MNPGMSKKAYKQRARYFMIHLYPILDKNILLLQYHTTNRIKEGKERLLLFENYFLILYSNKIWITKTYDPTMPQFQ